MSTSRYRICTHLDGNGETRYTAELKGWLFWLRIDAGGYCWMSGDGYTVNVYSTREAAEAVIAKHRGGVERQNDIARRHRLTKQGCEAVE